MDRGQAELPDRIIMLGRTIAFVPGKAIAGINGVQLMHQTVPGDLGQDRGSRDGVGLGIALDDGPDVSWHLVEFNRIYQEQVR